MLLRWEGLSSGSCQAEVTPRPTGGFAVDMLACSGSGRSRTAARVDFQPVMRSGGPERH